ncbi:MAG: hypothetical protein R6U22_02855 [Desulfohalobiaceae bacterium]
MISEEEDRHLQACKECQESLDICRQVAENLSAFLVSGIKQRCSYLEATLDFAVGHEEQDEHEIKEHIQKCPVCFQAYFLVRDFESSFEEKKSHVSLPENIRQKVRQHQKDTVADRTKLALEKLHAAQGKSRKWIEGLVQGAIQGKTDQPMPAARDDLTRSSRERDQKERDDADKAHKEKKDKDHDE